MAENNPLQAAQEIQTMLVDYAKQETIGPLRNLGRYLGLGLAGSVLIGIGVFFVGLATLRLTQTFEVFSGSSWGSMGPYAIAVVVLLAFMALVYSALSRAKKKVTRKVVS